MITDKIENAQRHAADEPCLTAAFKLLADAPFADKPDGRYEVDGKNLFYNVETYTTRPLDEGKLEAHKNYIDIQLITKGTELLAHTHLDGLEISTPYCSQRDIAFYHQTADMDSVVLTPGIFCLLRPENAHMPCRTVKTPTEVRKVVIKVRIAD